MATHPPIVAFFAFANDRLERARYLRNLSEEQLRVREVMSVAERAGHCEILDRSNCTVSDIFDVFQDQKYRHRVAIFHYGGHADDTSLILETPTGETAEAHGASLARFLGEQRSLGLVFLNGCSSCGQVQGLLDAGIPAVIATSQAIEDAVAARFAARFYKGIASGAPLRTAFNEAQEAIRTRLGDQVNKAYRPLTPEIWVAEERWPWELRVAAGAEDHVKRWSLPGVARDPLYGLPQPPEVDLPPSPFKHLHFFTRDDTAIFFGRGREIRELFDAVASSGTAPIILLFGVTGVGKSSLLDAGLRPRLEASYEVAYLRRDRELGLVGTIASFFCEEKSNFAAAWRQREKDSKRPLVVILDQVEEAWTRPLTGAREAAELIDVLRQIFATRDRRPRGRLLLSFRKEWLAEIQDLLNGAKLPFHHMMVNHLDRDAVMEVVAGPATSEPLRQRYRLTIEPELPEIIADNLLDDRSATIAPVLQILLTKMWALATVKERAEPRFSIDFYQELKRQGLLLEDFVREQLVGLRAWHPEFVDSGLALDLLAHHTTRVGSAESRPAAAVVERYGGRPEVVELILRCKDRYLLTGTVRAQGRELMMNPYGPADQGNIRLAHDTLAPIVRRHFERSDLPGQLAARILEQRAVEWADGKVGSTLADLDLAIVECGESSMRVRTTDENRLVEASRRDRARRRRRRRNRWLAVGAGGSIIATLAIITVVLWIRAESDRRKARDSARVAIAGSLLDRGEAIRANLALLEVRNPKETKSGENILFKAFAERELVRFRHEQRVTASSFNPNGSLVVTTSYDDTAKIWNATTGELVSTLQHTDYVLGASFSQDGSKVVTASRDRAAHVWNATAGELLFSLRGHEKPVTTACFNSDGTRIVTASRDKTARIWNAVTGQDALILQHTDIVLAASFSPDGSRVVTASGDKLVRIWNTLDGEVIATLRGHTYPVRAASFSPNSLRVVTASGDMTARTWEAATGKVIAVLRGHEDEVFDAVFSPDSQYVVTTSRDRTARVWKTSGERITTLEGHTALVWTASFSPDGRRIVTASKDTTARIWDASTGGEVASFNGHSNEVLTAAFNPDGSRVLTASKDQTARIWQTGEKTGALAIFQGHAGKADIASFSPDGRLIVTASHDNTARVWSVATGREIATFRGHEAIVDVALFSPDSSRVLTASRDGTARIWNVDTATLIVALEGHTHSVEDAAFSPDGSQVATASLDRSARIWSASAGEELSRLENAGSGTATSFSPDGSRVVTSFRDGTAKIWNPDSGELLVTLVGHKARIYSVSFSPDGSMVVTASKDRTARIWRVTTGEELGVLQGHKNSLMKASFSPDGSKVVTASLDTTARVWNTATGETRVLYGHTSVIKDASFSPDGSRIVTASNDTTARMWNAATGETIATFQGPEYGFEDASFSPDGSLIVTASNDSTPALWVASGKLHQALLRGRNSSCFDSAFRENTLGEPPAEAARNSETCRTCVLAYFERLARATAREGWRAHENAWKGYRACLESGR